MPACPGLYSSQFTLPWPRLPDVSIKDATEYLSDGSNEAFLRRLWRDLYGDEP